MKYCSYKIFLISIIMTSFELVINCSEQHTITNSQTTYNEDIDSYIPLHEDQHLKEHTQQFQDDNNDDDDSCITLSANPPSRKRKRTIERPTQQLQDEDSDNSNNDDKHTPSPSSISQLTKISFFDIMKKPIDLVRDKITDNPAAQQMFQSLSAMLETTSNEDKIFQSLLCILNTHEKYDLAEIITTIYKNKNLPEEIKILRYIAVIDHSDLIQFMDILGTEEKKTLFALLPKEVKSQLRKKTFITDEDKIFQTLRCILDMSQKNDISTEITQIYHDEEITEEAKMLQYISLIDTSDLIKFIDILGTAEINTLLTLLPEETSTHILNKIYTIKEEEITYLISTISSTTDNYKIISQAIVDHGEKSNYDYFLSDFKLPPEFAKHEKIHTEQQALLNHQIETYRDRQEFDPNEELALYEKIQSTNDDETDTDDEKQDDSNSEKLQSKEITISSIEKHEPKIKNITIQKSALKKRKSLEQKTSERKIIFSDGLDTKAITSIPPNRIAYLIKNTADIINYDTAGNPIFRKLQYCGPKHSTAKKKFLTCFEKPGYEEYTQQWKNKNAQFEHDKIEFDHTEVEANFSTQIHRLHNLNLLKNKIITLIS